MVKGWIEKKLGELFDISGGMSASRAQLSIVGYPYLHYGDIHSSTQAFIDVCADRTIPCIDVPMNIVSREALLQDGDIVFVDASEDDEGASRHIVVRNAKNEPFISGLHTIVAKAKTNEMDNRYKEYCFQTEAVKAQFKLYAVGTKVVGVNKTTIKNISLFFPIDCTEQRYIAETLSDMDELITALEKLIVKKQTIKQGAMQELLTGKRRLPGFSGEWVEKKLGHLCGNKISKGQLITEKQIKIGLIPVIAGGKVVAYYHNSYNRYENVITISASGANAGYVNFWSCKIFASDCTTIEQSSNYEVKFIYYCLLSKQNVIYALQAGGAQPHVQPPQLKELLLNVPLSIKEQTAIAAILSDMDAEIDALTVKLNKLKHIKQGMMSELLMGRIRLMEEKSIATTKILEFPKQETLFKDTYHGYSEGDKETVILVALVKKFSDEQHPFTEFDCQKFPYLFHRHLEGVAKGYKKFAAGPYNPSLKKETAIPTALGKKYIRECFSEYKGYVTTTNAQEALKCFSELYGNEPLKWLEQFRYIKNRKDELELLTTVDMAMVELRQYNTPISMRTVKEYIQNSEEWKNKLRRPIFSDTNIARAIKWSNELFGGTDNV
ncbi:MAG: restriction endonuclease subunit S [Fibromonadaceae bacterium]|jgi:type I restriction enzyme S subunit|nr:restriction endonuclease subunit S [Fibromonadaceae bacterium]